MQRIKLWAAAAVCGLSLAGNAFGQTPLRQQEADRLARDNSIIEREKSSMAQNRIWLERNNAELQQTRNAIQGKQLAVVLKTKQVINYRDSWRCPDGNSLAECRVHGNAKTAAINYINQRVASLQSENEAI